MNAPVTRRALLGATAAVGACALPAVAEAGFPSALPDVELFDLIARFDAARAAMDLTDEAVGEAMRRASAAYPPRPAALQWRSQDILHDLGGATGRERLPNGRYRAWYTDSDAERLRAAPPLTRWASAADDVEPHREPDPRGEARRREIVDSHDAWVDACRRVRDTVGLTAAQEADDAAALAWNAADDAVKHYQPRTLGGLAHKASWMAERLALGNCDDDLGEVFARQVAAFGGAAS